MKLRSLFVVAAAATASLLISIPSSAQTDSCALRITRANAVRCALAASFDVRAETAELSVSEARKEAVSPLLPANPIVTLSGDRRTGNGTTVTNWYATVGQELEIAGQRGARRDAADAAIEAQSARVARSKRDVAALAWVAYFDALAARDESAIIDRLATSTDRVAAAALARADQGLIAPVDADVAEAASLRLHQVRLEAERRADETRAVLASMSGLDPSRELPEIAGDLAPLSLSSAPADATTAVARRPEVRALDADRRAFALLADARRRSRIPNPTLSIFAQNDGFDEHVYGLGVSFPIPIPGNVGRTYRGEIAEAEASSLRATAERDATERSARLEIVAARQVYDARAKEAALYSAEKLSRAETSLTSLGQEVESGRLAIRDAVVAQQSLIEMLRANVEARRALCIASVALARALGLPLEGGAS